MPGPRAKPNGTRRSTPQLIPPNLARRIAGWQQTQNENRNSKLSFRKPGSQKK